MNAVSKPEFTKIKVNGKILLGAEHDLDLEILRQDSTQTQVARSAGSADSFELLPVTGAATIGQKLRPFLKDAPSGQLHIEGSGLTTSFGIFGAPGSGKTVLLMHLLEQVLAHKREDPERRFGALILDPKAALIDDVKEMLAHAGRSDDLRIINTDLLNSSDQGLNIIDCSLDAHELGAILVLAGQAAGLAASDPFWFQEWSNLFASTLSVLRIDDELSGRIDEPVTLRRILDAIFNELDEKGDGDKPLREIQGIARQIEKRLVELPSNRQADLQTDIQALDRFFTQDYVGTVQAFITKAFGMFRRSKLWCYSKNEGRGATPFYEDIIENGRIVLVSISPAEPILGKTLSTLVKSLFQRTVLGRGELLSSGVIRNAVRPLVIACDEYSEIASEVPGQSMGDGQFLALARQYGCMALLATQSVNVLAASSLKDTWRSVFSNFAAKIYMRLVDNETAEEASKLAGESEWKVQSHGRTVGGDNRQLSQQFDIRPRPNLPTSVLTQVIGVGQGVVIGSLKGGNDPGVHFIKVPFDPDRKLPAASKQSPSR